MGGGGRFGGGDVFFTSGGRKITGAEVSLRTPRTTTLLRWFPFEFFFFFPYLSGGEGWWGGLVVEDEKWSVVTTFDRFILPILCTFITVTAISDALP